MHKSTEIRLFVVVLTFFIGEIKGFLPRKLKSPRKYLNLNRELFVKRKRIHLKYRQV